MGRGVRQFGGGRTHALGIDKGEQLHIPHLADKVERRGKIFFRLAGEADNNVAGEGHAGDLFFRIIDEVHVLRDVVVAVHLLQEAVRPGLHRQMDVLAQMLLRSNRINELAAGIFRMARHEANLIVAGHLAQKIQQIGKVDGVFQPLAIAVDVLAQEGDFLVALGHQLLELCQNGGRFTAALPPADIRHDAVGAKVIATVHDGQPGAETGVPPDGKFLDHGVAFLGLFQVALAFADALRQHGG